MSIYSKLAVLTILFTFLVGYKEKSPTSSNGSSSTTTDTDSDISTTSYVGKRLNSDNTVGIDWKSDSFIYLCTSIQYYFSRSWIFSSPNTRLTWWDGT